MMTLRSLHHLLLLPVLLSLALALPTQARGPGPDSAIGVELHTVTEQPWGNRLQALGTVHARNQIDLISQTEGVISQLQIRDGMRVEQQQLLIQIDDRLPQTQLAEAKAALQDDQRQLAELSQLRASNSVSASSLRAQQAQVVIAQARVDAANVTLSHYRLEAPFAGVLGLSQLSVGQYIQRGEALLSLTDLDSLYLDFSLPSQYLSQLRLKQPLQLHFAAWPESHFAAEISSIDPTVDPQSRNVLIRAELNNKTQELRPGLLAQIDLMLGGESTLVLPTSAIFYRGSQAYVYVVDDTDTARQIAVEVGTSQGSQTQVLSGLQPGQQVVSAGVGKLSDGNKVKDLRSEAANVPGAPS
ncbi:efflux RND transporter periplasmic adaptor subunit [Ferrimonas pelagia]|uniref:Multidrug efflux RND transporter periplasmic adaptor subunit VmeE n=1 Tax=Ferrimonas pelagia TaxID=1177826 RepID=A0ABP9F7C7_9GAMM